MSEWWTEWSTYSLSDFLMFSARTYYRQFELMNRELWPLIMLAPCAGAAILGGMPRARPAGARAAFVLLCVAWLCVAWVYHLRRYADINTGAAYFAAGFVLQAALLGWMALRRQAAPAAGPANRIAMLVLVVALALYPLLAPASGRSWWQAEVFGLAPDPTVVATLAALLFWRAPWPLWVIPLLWCAASGATLVQLRAPWPWLPAGLAAVCVVAALARRSGRQQVAATE